MTTSFLSELLAEVTERGRRLIGVQPGTRTDDIGALCDSLLSGSGEASGAALARQILACYAELDEAGRIAFFQMLVREFGPDGDALKKAAQAYLADDSDSALAQLERSVEPRRKELIRRLNMTPGGTPALVTMRADLLHLLRDHPQFSALDRDFEHLFESWFNRGFLVLRRINWNTPAAILEKIIRYEAVHEIRDWADLRNRIEQPDRRLYAFFHPALVDDPLIFVEVALTRDMPEAIESVLDMARTPIHPNDAAIATFYSISNCQFGLRGISFGSFLIKQVADELTRELPRLKTFVTLSPIPGFASWLQQARKSGDVRISEKEEKTLALLERHNWPAHERALSALKPLLSELTAYFILRARDARGRIPDPVARFHLGNGARLERINWLADPSPNGMAQSHGFMVNYLYDLRDIEKNHEAYVNQGIVAASKAVRALAGSGRAAAEPVNA